MGESKLLRGGGTLLAPGTTVPACQSPCHLVLTFAFKLVLETVSVQLLKGSLTSASVLCVHAFSVRV